MANPHISTEVRSAQLIGMILTKVELNEKNFDVFVEILRKRFSNLGVVYKILTLSPRYYGHAPTNALRSVLVQCTLNLLAIPDKKRGKKSFSLKSIMQKIVSKSGFSTAKRYSRVCEVYYRDSLLPAGIKNQRLNCYASSIIQCLFNQVAMFSQTGSRTFESAPW